MTSDFLTPGPVVVDVAGTELTKQEYERLQHPLVGGVILFARNFVSRNQLCQLTQAIHTARPGPLFISVDHEGGRVQRFRGDGFTQIPAMRRIGALYETDPVLAQQLASDAAYVMGAELRACGVDLTYAPVLDIDYRHNEVIGERALHTTPAGVIALALGVIQGLGKAGMRSVGKHFPGHGFVSLDSHHETPVDERTLDELLATDLLPYLQLGNTYLAGVMPAHIRFPKVDAEFTAGFSKIWIQHVLRERLSYQGIIFSDDLTMHGAAYMGDIVARASAAITAGVDMVLVCNRPDMADDLLNRLDYCKTPELERKVMAIHPSDPPIAWDNLMGFPRYQDALQRLTTLVPHD